MEDASLQGHQPITHDSSSKEDGERKKRDAYSQRAEVQRLLKAFERGENVYLQGPPGVGKEDLVSITPALIPPTNIEGAIFIFIRPIRRDERSTDLVLTGPHNSENVLWGTYVDSEGWRIAMFSKLLDRFKARRIVELFDEKDLWLKAEIIWPKLSVKLAALGYNRIVFVLHNYDSWFRYEGKVDSLSDSGSFVFPLVDARQMRNAIELVQQEAIVTKGQISSSIDMHVTFWFTGEISPSELRRQLPLDVFSTPLYLIKCVLPSPEVAEQLAIPFVGDQARQIVAIAGRYPLLIEKLSEAASNYLPGDADIPRMSIEELRKVIERAASEGLFSYYLQSLYNRLPEEYKKALALLVIQSQVNTPAPQLLRQWAARQATTVDSILLLDPILHSLRNEYLLIEEREQTQPLSYSAKGGAASYSTLKQEDKNYRNEIGSIALHNLVARQQVTSDIKEALGIHNEGHNPQLVFAWFVVFGVIWYIGTTSFVFNDQVLSSDFQLFAFFGILMAIIYFVRMNAL